MDPTVTERRLAIGAEITRAGGVHFRVHAPRRRGVEVVLEAGPGAPARVELSLERDGYFGGRAPRAAAGTRYRFALDGEESLFPDPASRSQPDGPHAPSQVVDPGAFRWSDAEWRGVLFPGQVVYEVHVGTYTPEGTYAALERELPAIRELGITVVELMPIAEFPGRFGWGYDGVALFAPYRGYGAPDDLRRLVDRAHALGLAVILDVVYNHLGPDGNYLREYTADFFTDRHANEWGDAIDFDGPRAAGTRAFFVANAIHWIAEYHLDGFRFDATQQIHDGSSEHIVAEIVRASRGAARGKDLIFVAENERNDANLVRPVERGGVGLDAIWNDDFHHSARVAVTGRAEAYFSDHRGAPQELISALKWGCLFQGQRYGWQKARRGHAGLDLAGPKLITALQNHDQVANVGGGARLHELTSPGRLRAITCAWLLAPATPMLFQGQEFAASAPFLYFADHDPDLAAQVARGRRDWVRQFPSMAGPEGDALNPTPHEPSTFERCRLDLSERERNRPTLDLHRDLLRLRREDPTLRRQDRDRMHGAVLGPEALCLRFLGERGEDRLIVMNLGAGLELTHAPEPLLAPLEGKRWRVILSSEDPRYGGKGTPMIESEEAGWTLPGHATFVMAPDE